MSGGKTTVPRSFARLAPNPDDAEDRLLEDLFDVPGEVGTDGQDRMTMAGEALALTAGLAIACLALASGLPPMASGIAGLLATCITGFTAMPAWRS
ncbi:hypothetical protein [Novosphingobium sp. SG707]|uniref:hypothetical protein n=1 Tax=Novosphingobium sp. SG707 TaxID=2586996 RepID=UPI0014467191|nr:hypothetical protein [Novosphingobium sp. SG707]NKJ00358.1 hypothetical protein [Novosphingobium sp. SG707]